MQTIIYKIQNPLGQVYVGSTNRCISHRKAEHKYNIKRNRKGLLYNSFNDFGFDSHIFEEIVTVRQDTYRELEHFIISTFESKA